MKLSLILLFFFIIIMKDYITNIILLIILIFLANYLSKGSIINVLIRYFDKIKDYLFNNVHEEDDEEYMTKLYYFLESIISKNNNISNLEDKEYTLSKNETEELTKYLLKRLSNNEFKFINLNILDKLVYYKNEKGKYIKPFTFVSDVDFHKNHKEFEGTFKFNIEMFITFNNLHYSPLKSGFPEILSIKIFKENEGSCMYDHDSDSDNMIPDVVNLTDASQMSETSLKQTETVNNFNTETENKTFKDDFSISLPDI